MKNKKRNAIIVTIVAIVGIGMICLIADTFLNGHMFINLPGEYVIWSTENGQVLRYHPEQPAAYVSDYSSPTVGPDLDGYRVLNTAIVGHVTANEPYKLNYGVTDLVSGYFIIDLRTRKYTGGLDKRNWLALLKPHGITKEPQLFMPSWRDEKLGRNKPLAD